MDKTMFKWLIGALFSVLLTVVGLYFRDMRGNIENNFDKIGNDVETIKEDVGDLKINDAKRTAKEQYLLQTLESDRSNAKMLITEMKGFFSEKVKSNQEGIEQNTKDIADIKRSIRIR